MRYGAENVIASDVRSAPPELMAGGPFHYLDVTQADQLARIVAERGVDTIVHLAALLSPDSLSLSLELVRGAR